VQRYLRGRGITISPPSSLNFHPSLKHQSGSSFPAMVAAIEDQRGKFLGVQRTFLCADGSSKASVEPQKMSLGQLAGGAVRLAPKLADGVVLTEGSKMASRSRKPPGLSSGPRSVLPGCDP
jgi:DNA primase